MKVKSVSQNMSDLGAFDLNLLTVFTLIYSTGSISAASEVLGISSSAVSQSLKKLRVHFNDELFIRNGKSIKPTVYADDLFKLAEECLRKISVFIPTHEKKERLSIVIYTDMTLSQIVIPEIAIKSLGSDSEFNIIHNEGETFQAKVRQILEFRQADIAISGSKIQTKTISSTKLFRMNFILVTNKANRPYFTLGRNEVRNVNIIGLNVLGDFYPYYSHSLTRQYNLKPRRLITPSLATLFNVLVSGKCVAVIPDIIFEKNKEKFDLVQIKNTMKLPSVDVYMNYREELLENEDVNRFVNDISGVFWHKHQDV